jgi:hypothetical protein
MEHMERDEDDAPYYRNQRVLPVNLRFRRIRQETCKAGAFYCMIATPLTDGSVGIRATPAVLEYFNPLSEEWEQVKFEKEFP